MSAVTIFRDSDLIQTIEQDEGAPRFQMRAQHIPAQSGRRRMIDPGRERRFEIGALPFFLTLRATHAHSEFPKRDQKRQAVTKGRWDRLGITFRWLDRM